MSEPWTEVEYEAGPCTPNRVKQVLAERLGAREGDVVVLYSDGSVALGRRADAETCVVITRFLLGLHPTAVRPYRDAPAKRGHLTPV